MKELNNLPVMTFFKKCAKCGASEPSSFNFDPASPHVIKDCNQCPDYPERLAKWKAENTQVVQHD